MQTTSTSEAIQFKISQERVRLAKTWIYAQQLGVGTLGYDRHSWAVDELVDLAFHQPDTLWELILRILEIDRSDKTIAAIGAGPLEDLMVQHGEAFIGKVERLAAISPVFKAAMQNVWIEAGDTPVFNKFFAIAGVAPPSQRKGRRQVG
ncbi:MAG TPA: hypothetical protein VGA88_00590 [Burkholderiales bacterium]